MDRRRRSEDGGAQVVQASISSISQQQQHQDDGDMGVRSDNNHNHHINNNDDDNISETSGRTTTGEAAQVQQHRPPPNHQHHETEVFESASIRSESSLMGQEYNSQSHHVIGEKVQTLASQIYTQLQLILSRIPDDPLPQDSGHESGSSGPGDAVTTTTAATTKNSDCVSGLMPLIVSVLESLDVALIENQQLQVELELCRDDNEQLVLAFEKEKSAKKRVEQKLLELEFAAEEEKQALTQKMESVENVVRVLELRAKNSSDQTTRCEERESELKNEYSKLHVRYTELLRSHCDLMERVKILIGSDSPSSSGTTGPATTGSHTESVVAHLLRNFLSRKKDVERALESEERMTTSSPSDRTYDRYSTAGRWAVDPDLSLDDPQPESLILTDERQAHDSLTPHQQQQPLSLLSIATSTGGAQTDSNFFGMEKEVENLISENNELLATKNALNIVKDDLIAKVDALESELTFARDEREQVTLVKNKFKSRITELEEELKRTREQLDESRATLEKMRMDDEEGIPAVQRKRFTRLEMARVLMERNQYKEKLIELQEAVRWTELIRATRGSAGGSDGSEKRSAIWKFFSNLFAGGSTTAATATPDAGNSATTDFPSLVAPGLRYANNSVSPATTGVSATPALDAMRRRAMRQQQDGDPLAIDDSSARFSHRPLHRQQTRNRLRSQSQHVVSAAGGVAVGASDVTGGRIHAYGWSIPVTNSSQDAGTAAATTSVPVPTYCRPLFCEENNDTETGMKIWCACAVDLSGGASGGTGDPATRDEDLVVEDKNKKNSNITSKKKDQRSRSSSSSSSRKVVNPVEEDNDTSTGRIRALESELQEAMDQSMREWSPSEKSLSTFVWLCSVSASRSRVTVINIRSNPSEVLDSFLVKTHLLCIASIPGAKDTDFQHQEDPNQQQATPPVGVSASVVAGEIRTGVIGRQRPIDECREVHEESKEEDVLVMEDKLSHFLAYSQPQPSSSSPAAASVESKGLTDSGSSSIPLPSSPVYQPMSSILPTIWLGGQNNHLYIHSSVAQWSHCIACLKLPDSVLHITHIRGRVFVALANGTVCLFSRRPSDQEFDFRNYLTIDIGLILATSIEQRTSSTTSHTGNSNNNTNTSTSTRMSVSCSIRCLEVAKGNLLWLGYRNLVFILDPQSLQVVSHFPVHPRKESQVRQLSALGDGVWCSLRLDSTLRLYSAIRPSFVHLQDIDVEPQVGKILSPKSAFSFIRITALKASGSRLWIGTANGVILSIPFFESTDASDKKDISRRSSSSVLSPTVIVSTPTTDGRQEEERLSVSTFVPMCDAASAQLSFHGHRDAVKFFVCTKNLITSGGDGYIDFRVDEEPDQVSGHLMSGAGQGNSSSQCMRSCDRSHLIVWELMQHQVSQNPTRTRRPSDRRVRD